MKGEGGVGRIKLTSPSLQRKLPSKNPALSGLVTDILVHLNLWNINRSCQYPVDEILGLILHWLFLIQNLQLLVFCINDLEYMAL